LSAETTELIEPTGVIQDKESIRVIKPTEPLVDTSDKAFQGDRTVYLFLMMQNH
jgi:hypothetical protein